MYTILINKDKSLTTSVKSTLIKETTTDEIVFLMNSPEPQEEDLPDNVTIDTSYEFSALLRYVVKSDGILKTETLVSSAEKYKDKIKFVLPKKSLFFRNGGMVELWLDITTNITVNTTVTEIDSETGEETSTTTTDSYVEEFTTLPTTLFIDNVPWEKNCPWYKDDNTIKITRGDSLNIQVELTDNNGYPYVPVEGDQVWFTVKKSAAAEDVLIRKGISTETLNLEIVESDTRNLAFGDYKYEIEVITAVNNDHYTVIKNAPFVIMEELHE